MNRLLNPFIEWYFHTIGQTIQRFSQTHTHSYQTVQELNITGMLNWPSIF